MGAVSRKRCSSPEERRARYLEAQWRYNRSRKGKTRYVTYEAKHPERAENRWPTNVRKDR